ncbi:MAG: GYD domain-containing protein [Dehalococcoidia bacterium]
MPLYISLINWTDQGIRNVKQSPQRLEAVNKAAEAVGGRMVDFYLTMGRYDIVAVFDLPSDEAAATFLLSVASQGNVRTETLKAFDIPQYRSIINNIP